MQQNNTFKYFAFISYSSKDLSWGKTLQRKLERFRMPALLCRERGWKRTPINPVFFAPTDIQPGGLSDELQQKLNASRNLIVICSPHSAKSEWVAKEIAYFHQLGRTKSIHLFIVDGIPNSKEPDTECINPIFTELGIAEILAANIHEHIYNLSWLNKERAYIQLISKLLDVDFDSIWHRHQRYLTRQIIGGIASTITLGVILGFVWQQGQPMTIQVRIHEASSVNPRLPQPKFALLKMSLDEEVKSDTLRDVHSTLPFPNIPHKMLGRNTRFYVSCEGFQDLDTVVSLSRYVILNIYRNPEYYGRIRFFLTNHREETISNVRIMVDNHEAISDSTGHVNILVPLNEQATSYSLSSSYPLADSVFFTPASEDASVWTK